MDDAKLEQVAEQAVTEKPKMISRTEWKALMRQYFTQRLPELSCGHKFHTDTQPKNNCELCWVTFFQHHQDLIGLSHQIYKNEGKAALVQVRGEKYVKFFERFMATLVRLEKQMQEQNDSANSETSGEQREVQADSSSGEGAQ